jgi:hypothetical protein
VTERIFRYEVPVDGDWHDLELHGPVLHVACRKADVVELWAAHRDTPLTAGAARIPQRFTVVGTGHALPVHESHWLHVGTAIAPGGELVWHLIKESW